MNLGVLTLEILNKEKELKLLREERMSRVPHPSLELQEELYGIEMNVKHYMENNQFDLSKQIKYIDAIIELFSREGYK